MIDCVREGPTRRWTEPASRVSVRMLVWLSNATGLFRVSRAFGQPVGQLGRWPVNVAGQSNTHSKSKHTK